MEAEKVIGGNIDKVEINDRHFQRKLKERLGWELTKELKHLINVNLTERNFIKNLSKTRKLYIMYIKGLYLAVVYDKKRKSLITAWKNIKEYYEI